MSPFPVQLPAAEADTDWVRYRRRRLHRLAGLAVAALVSTLIAGWPQAHASSRPSVSSSRSSQAGGVPSPPGSVALDASPDDNTAVVYWQPSTGATRYDIGVFEGTGSSLHQVGAVSCNAPCTSETLQADPGTTTSVVVDAADSAGRSQAVWSRPVQIARPCPLACLTVAAGHPGATGVPLADGFLVPDKPRADGSVLPALAPAQWRTNRQTLAATPPATFTQLGGAAITDIISDDWNSAHNSGGYALTPWSNWTLYSQWVTSDVRQVEALGRQDGFNVTYWEVQNEPFGGYYYSDSAQPPASETIANFEEQFLVAYRAIKAADPNAQVIGPSLIAWEPAQGISMATFLDFAAANHISLAGISFHDNNFGTLPGWYAADNQPAQPSEVEADVAQLRQMLAALPALGHPAILVNEYGDPYTSALPGWTVGRIAALGAAGVTGANRSCWNDCNGAALDGLLTPHGSSPLPDYWVYAFYARMTGQSVPVTSSYTDVTGLATVDPSGTVQVLVGRHQSCTKAIRVYCPSSTAETATVRVQVPGAAQVRVTSAAIPMGSTPSTPLTSLSPSSAVEPVTGGWVTVTTPALYDGDAAEITVTPVG